MPLCRPTLVRGEVDLTCAKPRTEVEPGSKLSQLTQLADRSTVARVAEPAARGETIAWHRSLRWAEIINSDCGWRGSHRCCRPWSHDGRRGQAAARCIAPCRPP